MADPLASGTGARSARASVLLSLTPLAAEAGHSAEAVRAVFAAAHAVNRGAADGRRVAIDLPGLRPGAEGLDRLGGEIALYADADLIDAVLADKRISRLVRSGALASRRTDGAPQTHGLVRERRGEKSTAAGLARARRRVERRGGTWEDRPHRGGGLTGRDPGAVFVTLDERVRLVLRRRPVSAGDVVSGYGALAAAGA